MRLDQTNEQLIAHDKMQKEFINIAAHELKRLYNRYFLGNKCISGLDNRYILQKRCDNA